MNRLIKFRVWDNKKKIWLDKTDFCIYNGDAQEVEIGGTEYLYNGSSYNPLKFVENDIGGLYCNRNLIIQQYTGLNDKNGEEIYEGDIVKINRCYTRPFVNEKQQIDYRFIDDGEVEVGQVLWGWNSQKYLVSYEHIRYDDIEDFDKPSHKVEVIGNIFENPELLK